MAQLLPAPGGRQVLRHIVRFAREHLLVRPDRLTIEATFRVAFGNGAAHFRVARVGLWPVGGPLQAVGCWGMRHEVHFEPGGFLLLALGALLQESRHRDRVVAGAQHLHESSGISGGLIRARMP